MSRSLATALVDEGLADDHPKAVEYAEAAAKAAAAEARKAQTQK